jgi:hypothetical protein
MKSSEVVSFEMRTVMVLKQSSTEAQHAPRQIPRCTLAV